jgi:putative FmdB family regulatory protein
VIQLPLYEYECTACGHRFEVIQKFSDLPVEKCPKCGKPVERLISSPAIQFKGTGWYVTDYAKRRGPTDTKGESKPANETPKQAAATGPTKGEQTKESGSSTSPSSTNK